MIFDKEVLLAENLAFDGAGPEIEIGSLTSNIGPGRGQVIPIHISGENVTGVAENYILIESSNDGTNWGNEMMVGAGPQVIMDGGVTFGLSTAVSRYIRLSFTGFTAGTFTGGIIADFLLG